MNHKRNRESWRIDETQKNAPYWPAFGITNGDTIFWVQTAQDANVASAVLNALQSALQEAEAERDAAKALVAEAVPFISHFGGVTRENAAAYPKRSAWLTRAAALTPSQTEEAGT